MRPTRRGYTALTVVVIALAFAWSTGPRALNAIAAPVLVAVGVGAFQVYRTGSPTIERTLPSRGFPGDTRTVELTVEGSGVATINDPIDDGLSGSATVQRSLPTTINYEVTYDRRGVHSLGPATVSVRDVLGLVEETYETTDITDVLVYPKVYSIGDPGSFLRTLGPESDERTEFDRLREYVPGDSLRDVHWKTSAKYDDLLVTEFTDPTDEESVTIAASYAPGHEDEMAVAAATLFAAAMRAGLSVELYIPSGTLPFGYGETHKHHVLEALARVGNDTGSGTDTEIGTIPDHERESADVRILADESGVAVAIADRSYSLEDLTVARDNPLRRRVVA